MAKISVSQALLASLIVIMLVSVAFVYSAEEEEDEGSPALQDGVFTYSIRMELDGAVYNGTYVENTLVGFSDLTWENETFGRIIEEGRRNGSAYMFLAPWRIGFFPTLIDKVRMDTPWGEKELDRSIIFWPDMEGGFLMNVMYGGGETYLNYRQDIITSQWRASFLLTDVQGADIIGRDEEWSDRSVDVGNSRQHFGDVWTMLGGDDLRVMRTDGKQYEVTVKNYAYYHFSQDVILDMFEGGLLRYDQERSIIGNGSVSFELEGQWYLRLIIPVGDQPNIFLMETSD